MDSSHDSSHVRSRLWRRPSPLSAAVELDGRALGAIAEWKGGSLTTPVNFFSPPSLVSLLAWLAPLAGR